MSDPYAGQLSTGTLRSGGLSVNGLRTGGLSAPGLNSKAKTERPFEAWTRTHPGRWPTLPTTREQRPPLDYKEAWPPLQSPANPVAALAAYAFGFRCEVKKISGAWKRGIYHDSALYQTLDHTAPTNPDGLLTSLTPTTTDAGYIDTSTTDVVWAEAAFQTGIGDWPALMTSGGFKIKSIGNGDSFGGGELEYLDTSGTGAGPFVQAFARFVIAVMGANSNSDPYIQYQLINGNIFFIDGFAPCNDSSGSNSQTIAVKWRSP